jgi:hypothetical protein
MRRHVRDLIVNKRFLIVGRDYPWAPPLLRLHAAARYLHFKVPGGKAPLFREEDVEEQFVRGGGKGGQAVAKSSNCVLLKHVPSGQLVRCHATRSQEQNRRLARLELHLRLDEACRGGDSVRGKKAAKLVRAAAKRANRARAKYGAPHRPEPRARPDSGIAALSVPSDLLSFPRKRAVASRHYPWRPLVRGPKQRPFSQLTSRLWHVRRWR